MDFRLLQLRLVSHVRARVRNGELSERGLARLSGVSQPHIHNVLKGTRLLSAQMADQMLQRLRIDLAELLTADETDATHSEPARDSSLSRTVGMLDGLIGREHPYPETVGRERYPFPVAVLDRLVSPVAARLAPDPLRAPIFAGRCVVLLDRSEEVRLNPDDEGYFALDLTSGGTIGLVRRAGPQFSLWVRQADVWHSIVLPNRNPLDVVRGRVSLVVRHL
jgi:transcriptional regulator with XRE-family HTH domain